MAFFLLSFKNEGKGDYLNGMPLENLEGETRWVEREFFDDGLGGKARPGICIIDNPFFVAPATTSPHDETHNSVMKINKSYPPVLKESPFWVLLGLSVRGGPSLRHAFVYGQHKGPGVRLPVDVVSDLQKRLRRLYGLE